METNYRPKTETRDQEFLTELIGAKNMDFLNAHVDQPELYEMLSNLLPSREPDALVRLTGPIEGLIRSRYKAEYTDFGAGIKSQEGIAAHPILSYPKKLTEWTTPILFTELTDRCTVACPFCAFADKGPISKKMSKSQVLNITNWYEENFLNNISKNVITFHLYGNTDPFDYFDRHEGESEEESYEFDYVDIMEEMHKIDAKLFTSTALPIGSELQVIRAIEFFLGNHKSSSDWTFRIERTDRNSERLDSIIEFFIGKYGINFEEDNDISIIDRTAETGTLFETGKKLTQQVQRGESISIEDIMGNPTCYDGYKLTPEGVVSVFRTLPCQNYPSGYQEKLLHYDARNPRLPAVHDLAHHVNIFSYLTNKPPAYLSLSKRNDVILDEAKIDPFILLSRDLSRVLALYKYLSGDYNEFMQSDKGRQHLKKSFAKILRDNQKLSDQSKPSSGDIVIDHILANLPYNIEEVLDHIEQGDIEFEVPMQI